MSNERRIVNSNSYNPENTFIGSLWSIIGPLVSVINTLFRSIRSTEPLSPSTIIQVGENTLTMAGNLFTQTTDSEHQKKVLKKLVQGMHILADLANLYTHPNVAAFQKGFHATHNAASWLVTRLADPSSSWSFEFFALLDIIKSISLPQFLDQLENELWHFDNGTTRTQLQRDVQQAETAVTNAQRDVTASETIVKGLQDDNNFNIMPKIKALWPKVKALRERLSTVIPENTLYSIECRLKNGWKLYSVKYPTWGMKSKVKHNESYTKFNNVEGIKKLLAQGYKVRLYYPETGAKSLNYIAPGAYELTKEANPQETAYSDLWMAYRKNEVAIFTEQKTLTEKISALTNAKKHLALAKELLEAFVFKNDIKSLYSAIINYDWRNVDLLDLTDYGINTWGTIKFIQNINKTNYFKHIKDHSGKIALGLGAILTISKVLDYLYHSRGATPGNKHIILPGNHQPSIVYGNTASTSNVEQNSNDNAAVPSLPTNPRVSRVLNSEINPNPNRMVENKPSQPNSIKSRSLNNNSTTDTKKQLHIKEVTETITTNIAETNLNPQTSTTSNIQNLLNHASRNQQVNENSLADKMAVSLKPNAVLAMNNTTEIAQSNLNNTINFIATENNNNNVTDISKNQTTTFAPTSKKSISFWDENKDSKELIFSLQKNEFLGHLKTCTLKMFETSIQKGFEELLMTLEEVLNVIETIEKENMDLTLGLEDILGRLQDSDSEKNLKPLLKLIEEYLENLPANQLQFN